MATLTWRGSTNNRASNTKSWSPSGPPQPGDDLQLRGSITSNTFTMNISGNDLAGDPLRMYGAHLTANLSHQAAMTAVMWLSNAGTFNLSQNSALNLTLSSGYHVGINTATVNLTGTNTLTLNNSDSQVNVNLLSGARWNGTMTLGPYFGVVQGLTTVNGNADAKWNNNGASVVNNTETAVVNVDVVGTGTFNINAASMLPSAMARMEFVGAVGANQTILDSGVLVLDKPKEFAGHITLSTAASVNDNVTLLPAEIDLVGLGGADSYSFKNDMLKIYAGNTVIDKLHLTDQTAHGFLIEKMPGSLNITAIIDPAHTPIAMLDNALPIHV